MTNISRRRLLAGSAGAAAAGIPLAAQDSAHHAPDFASLRDDFPWGRNTTFLNNAGWHPLPASAFRAMQKYLDYQLNGPGTGRGDFDGRAQRSVKGAFAQLINANPSEISFVQSTTTGENLVVAGLGIPGSDWNVVTDELHYEASLYLYGSLKRQGLDVRIAKPREWRLEPADYERLVDRKTRLVATSLVSYINGHVHRNIRGLADLAHSHGGYLYTDIIQAAGAVPIDMRAMNIDFAACSSYKWLMGSRGFGYLFVRDDLQGKILRRTQYGDRQFVDFDYHIFPFDSSGPAPATWQQGKGAGSFYEVGNISNVAGAGQVESLAYILRLGMDNIRAHARPLTERLRREIPGLGFPCITPENNESPIVSFVVKDPMGTRAKLKKANVNAKVGEGEAHPWHQMRVSPSVYNTQEDIDRLLNALG